MGRDQFLSPRYLSPWVICEVIVLRQTRIRPCVSYHTEHDVEDTGGTVGLHLCVPISGSGASDNRYSQYSSGCLEPLSLPRPTESGSTKESIDYHAEAIP
jgi:hypothetical protein